MELHEGLRAALPDCTFRPPASEDDVRRVERELGVTLPDDIRRLYLAYDGFSSGDAARVELLPLVGPTPPAQHQESVLRWNQFLRGGGWEKGYEPPEHVLELAVIDDDTRGGIDLRTGEVVIVERRGNEVFPADGDLYDLLVEEYYEQRRFGEESDAHVFQGTVEYVPVKKGEGAERDIDRIIWRYLEVRSGIHLRQVIGQPGVWIDSVGFEPGWEQIRLKSATGNFPFLVESDVSGLTLTLVTVDEVVALIDEQAQYSRRTLPDRPAAEP